MGQPYVGEIRIVGFNFAPAGWAFCDGSILPISQNDTLFNLIGTTYGGDGQNTFALPDLRGRSPVHTGGSLSYQLGQTGGVENVTLTSPQLPVHNHPVTVQGGAGNSNVPTGGFLAGSSVGQYAAASATGVTATLLQNNTGSQPHDNLMPYLTLNFVISLYGVFPSQN
jgi:microcystin-dependent protein